MNFASCLHHIFGKKDYRPLTANRKFKIEVIKLKSGFQNVPKYLYSLYLYAAHYAKYLSNLAVFTQHMDIIRLEDIL